MRTYELRGKGMDGLNLVERPVPKPGPGQALVRVHAVSLNYRDLLVANGTYPRGPATEERLVPCSDAAGEVVELGSGASRLKKGDRVMASFFQGWLDGPFVFDVAASSALGGSIDGVLAEYVALDTAGLVKAPHNLGYEAASTLPCAGVTAWVALHELASIGPGQTLLALGTGGVSLFALQLAQRAGAGVLLTSSNDEKLARGKRLGADATINYRSTPEWDVMARELTRGRGVDQIIEVGGAGTLERSLRALRDGGRITLAGQLSGDMANRDVAEKNGRNIHVDQVFVGSAQHLERLARSIEQSPIAPVVDHVFEFDAAREAFQFLESGAHFGKVVIRV
ncbi:MAG TPA: NAD(P)-dependent alcohol dehydrogenase [Polyangiaceae bacterium]|nr:NAD(P)-dependent alcohol dehydrogenase [Polyangiaceae bacterium]